MYQVNSTKDIAEVFKKHLKAGHFVKDKTGVNTIEVIGASFVADKPAIFGVPNQEYIQAELDWYESRSTNISDIYPEGDKEPPQAWQYTANVHGEINSNYGHLIFSKKYHRQYNQVLKELSEVNPDSRRASMIYQRPSIWREYKENGKNDFICTNAVTYYIRDGYLHAAVQMRSNDVMFGYRNDYAWQRYVQIKLQKDLYFSGVHVELGHMYWQVQNLHVYERHFDLVK
mgnify:FL=1|tara:strand:- start:1916 stop:2602 length:687 start_codon:yes stop_codon:yes gene_type:complete